MAVNPFLNIQIVTVTFFLIMAVNPFLNIQIITRRFLLSPFIVPPVLLQTISTLRSLLMACRKCIQ